MFLPFTIRSKLISTSKNGSLGANCRVFQIRTGTPDPDSWKDVFLRISECCLATLTAQIIQYDDDSRRLEQQRLIPGWNYCQYFLIKEAMVFTYEIAGLFEEALMQYDELEASFFQTMIEQGVPWFKKFGSSEPLDDSRDILDYATNTYREQIIQNSITIFGFRLYLFSRQCQLLLALKQPDQILIRGKRFITSFSQTLLEYTSV